ncbi:unnamed protein product [Ostreobium quekettii]|uniref:GON domain-containing protein n=1 Tax=Ostreobium quekettii TaxID=121088 RepID=A0A8S1J9T2_9CHLO|nr:unnamed protein product [Ostreobium quekettii]
MSPRDLCAVELCCRRLRSAVRDYIRGLPTSAADLQRRGCSSDGDYHLRWAAAPGKSVPVGVYCHGMGRSEPKEYLRVRAGPWDNYSFFRSGGTATGTDVTTVFEMVRIRMPGGPGEPPVVVCADFTFSRSSGGVVLMGGAGGRTTVEHAVYGVAQNSAGEPTSHAGVDLRGTPFAAMCDFEAFGNAPVGQATVTHARQVVKLEGGGYRGGCGPPGAGEALRLAGGGRAEDAWAAHPQTIPLKLRDSADLDAVGKSSSWSD